MPIRHLPAALMLLYGAGCATSGNGDRQSPDTSGVAPVDPAGATAPPPVVAFHPLVGSWRLASTTAAREPGIRIELTIDSVPRDAIHARLRSVFAGNAGIEPGRYGPLTGTVRGDTLAMGTPPAPDGGRIGFAGRIAGDTIRLWRFVYGPDDLAAGQPGRWMLVR